ncbi:MAG: MinD/ParA family protein [Eubacteriales bacterium]
MDQAEQLRNIIKNKVQERTKNARTITVTSGKGGVGKSNTSINLAIQFKKMGKRVIILDADFGLANIEIMFGLMPKYNLSDLIYNGKSIKDIITWGPMGVGFISGGSGIAGLDNLSSDSINYIVQSLTQLDELADIVIIDTGAGISPAVMQFLVASSEILLVTTPEPTSITDSYSLVKTLGKNPYFSNEFTQIKVIANKVESEKEGKVLYNKLSLVIEKYLKIKTEYAGAVPNDTHISKAVMQQMPVSIQNPNVKATKAYETIAYHMLQGVLEDDVEIKKGMAAFFERILKGNQLEKE